MKKWQRLSKTQIILVIGLLTSLIPVTVQQFQHYFLNAFPYMALLYVTVLPQTSWPRIPVHLVLLCMAGLLAVRIGTYAGKKDMQLQVAKQVEANYPKGGIAYLKGGINFLYVLNQYRNPVLKTAGYGYLFKPDDRFYENQTVLTFDAVPTRKAVRILSVNGQKIYDY